MREEIQIWQGSLFIVLLAVFGVATGAPIIALFCALSAACAWLESLAANLNSEFLGLAAWTGSFLFAVFSLFLALYWSVL